MITGDRTSVLDNGASSSSSSRISTVIPSRPIIMGLPLAELTRSPPPSLPHIKKPAEKETDNIDTKTMIAFIKFVVGYENLDESAESRDNLLVSPSRAYYFILMKLISSASQFKEEGCHNTTKNAIHGIYISSLRRIGLKQNGGVESESFIASWNDLREQIEKKIIKYDLPDLLRVFFPLSRTHIGYILSMCNQGANWYVGFVFWIATHCDGLRDCESRPLVFGDMMYAFEDDGSSDDEDDLSDDEDDDYSRLTFEFCHIKTFKDKTTRTLKAMIGKPESQMLGVSPDGIWGLNGVTMDKFGKSFEDLRKEYKAIEEIIVRSLPMSDSKRVRYNYIKNLRVLTDAEIDACYRRFVPLCEMAGLPANVLYNISVHSSTRVGLVQAVTRNIAYGDRAITDAQLRISGTWSGLGERKWNGAAQASEAGDSIKRARYHATAGAGGSSVSPRRSYNANVLTNTPEEAYRASVGAAGSLLVNSIANPLGGVSGLNLPVLRPPFILPKKVKLNPYHLLEVIIGFGGLDSMKSLPKITNPSVDLTVIITMDDSDLVFRVIKELALEAKIAPLNDDERNQLVLLAVCKKELFIRKHSDWKVDSKFSLHVLLSVIRGYERTEMKNYLSKIFKFCIKSVKSGGGIVKLFKRFKITAYVPAPKVSDLSIKTAIDTVAKWNLKDLNAFIDKNMKYDTSRYPIGNVVWPMIVAKLIGEKIDYTSIAKRVNALVQKNSWPGQSLGKYSLNILRDYTTEEEYDSYMKRVSVVSKESQDLGRKKFNWDEASTLELTSFINEFGAVPQLQGWLGIVLTNCDAVFQKGYSVKQISDKVLNIIESVKKRKYKVANDLVISKAPSNPQAIDQSDAVDFYKENSERGDDRLLLNRIQVDDLFIESRAAQELRVGAAVSQNGYASVQSPRLQAARLGADAVEFANLLSIGNSALADLSTNNPAPVIAVVGGVFTGAFNPNVLTHRYFGNTLTWHPANLIPNPNVAQHLLIQAAVDGIGNPNLLVNNATFNAAGDFNVGLCRPTALRVWNNGQSNGIKKASFATHQDTRCPLCGFRLINFMRQNETIPICHAIPRVVTSENNNQINARRMLTHFSCYYSGLSNYNFMRSMSIRCGIGEYSWGVSKNGYDTPSDPLNQAGANPELVWTYVECLDLVIGVKIFAGRNGNDYLASTNWGQQDWIQVRLLCPILQSTGKSILSLSAHWNVIGPTRNVYLTDGNEFL